MEHIATAARPVAASLSTRPPASGGLSTTARPILDKKQLPELFKKSTDRDLVERVVSSWTGSGPDKDEKGEAVLSRPLRTEERLALELRVQELRSALAPTPASGYDVLFDAVGAMLGAFPTMQRHAPEAAAMIAEGYCHSIREQPQWAVLEACQRIRENKAGLNPSYCPTEPEFAEQVRRCVQPYRSRLWPIEAVIRGTPIKPVSQEDRERVEALAKAHLAGTRPVADLETEQRQKNRAEFVARIAKGERERRLREYTKAGLDAPEEQGFGVVSLPLLLSMGWCIKKVKGENVLVRPVVPPPLHRYSHADESR